MPGVFFQGRDDGVQLVAIKAADPNYRDFPALQEVGDCSAGYAQIGCQLARVHQPCGCRLCFK